MAAEYIVEEGNRDVILCERGIRTFETATRNTLDISAVPVVQARQPPADHRRPQPRHGTPRPGAAALAGGRRRGRRRRDRRDAPQSRARPVRRPAVAADRRRSPSTPRACATSSPGPARPSAERRARRPRRRRRGSAVIGVGLMGGSLGLAARARAGVDDVLGYSRSRETLELALERGAITVGLRRRSRRRPPAPTSSSSRRRCASSSSTCAARSPRRARRRRHQRRGQHQGALMQRADAREQRRCVGGHPLCGAETAGVGNARASLYDGATYFLTPGAHVDAGAYQRLHDFVTADRRATGGGRPRRARSHHGARQSSAARAGERAHDAGGRRQRARATRC